MRVEERTVRANGLAHRLAVSGAGPTVVLLHGFPHTWRVWEPVLGGLATESTVVAPDLRGLGDTERPRTGFAAGDIADDVVALLDALEVEEADVVGLDLGAPAALMTALRHPGRVWSVTVMEALLGTLPGADDFVSGGPPWWFGFHDVPGLAESVLVGHESEYVDWFLETGTLGDGPTDAFRTAVHDAYARPGALGAAFEHYRAMPTSADQIAAASAARPLSMPALAIGAASVGDATFRQLRGIAPHAEGVVIEDSGHIVPQHRPEQLLRVLGEFTDPGVRPPS